MGILRPPSQPARVSMPRAWVTETCAGDAGVVVRTRVIHQRKRISQYNAGRVILPNLACRITDPLLQVRGAADTRRDVIQPCNDISITHT